MFEIVTYNFAEKNFNDWDTLFDYHCTYILENGKDAYIGESNDFVRRGKEHSIDEEKKKYNFQRIHIITSKISEETPAKHYEDLLIKLMRADKKFNIINSHKSEIVHYPRKNLFEIYFDDLWFKLEQKGLVNTKNFRDIINSSLFKYSLCETLTEEQCKTLTSIIHTLDSGEINAHKDGFQNRPIIINGDAGTGKTVVAVSLFYYLRHNESYKNKKIALVYANPSTRAEIKNMFKYTDGLSEHDVIAPIAVTKQYYDIIICDEAQRLRCNFNLGMYSSHFRKGNERLGFDNNHDELDWILKNSKYQILFYDEKQVTTPCDIPVSSYEDRLSDRKRGIRPITLNEQMRIQAGDRYVPYIFDVLYQRTETPQNFENYDFKLFNSFKDMANLLEQKESAYGLSRFCTGYDWEWKAKEDSTLIDIQLDGINLQWNKQTEGWLRNPDATKQMGSIYTLPGIDLNYAAVIIGPCLYFDKSDNKIKINKKNFFDNKVKRGVNDEDLYKYILNTYAVFLTRGIKGTYVYVCDKNLREYLSKFITIA